MSSIAQAHANFFSPSAKICALLSIGLLFGYHSALAKTVTITCPVVKTTLTAEYQVPSSSDGYKWKSWQSQPRLEVSTANDKNYFAEINQSYKGIDLRCVGGSGNKSYGFYTHNPKITACKIDVNSNQAFVCQVND